MKRTLIMMCVVLAGCWSMMTMAMPSVGVVNMKQVFEASSQAKNINSNLEKQFSSAKDKIEKMGKALQANMKKYQKNQSVMSKKKLVALRRNIAQQEIRLRQSQMKFRQALFAAQSKKMAAFLKTIRSKVASIAKQKKLDVVLAKSGVLYSKSNLDITNAVISGLNK